MSKMKAAIRYCIAALAMAASLSAQGAEVFLCGEPKGVSMWSAFGHKPDTDGYSGVRPIVVIDGNSMSVAWGDTAAAGGADRVWRAVVVHRDEDSVSAVDADTGANGSAVMLFTMDVTRRFLYMSTHRHSQIYNASKAASFVSSCDAK